MRRKLHVLAGLRKTIESCLISIENQTGINDIEGWQNLILDQTKRCGGKISNLKYALSAAQYAEYLKHCYHDTLELRYQIFAFKESHQEFTGNSILSKVCDDIIQTLDELFSKLSLPDNFYKDFDYPCANAYASECLAELASGLLVLRAKMKTREISIDLQDCVLDYYNSLRSKNKHTYSSLYYARTLLDSLTNLLGDNKIKHWDTALRNTLIACNFNTSNFYTYYIDRINTSLSEASTAERRLEIVLKHILDIKRVLQEPQMACNTGIESISTFLFNYLLEEREACRSSIVQIPSIPEDLKLIEQTESKLSSKLNMRELAMFISLAMSVGIIDCKAGEQKQVATFYARHFKTVGQENLSGDSLYKRLKEKDATTCHKMISLLETMITIIHSYEII